MRAPQGAKIEIPDSLAAAVRSQDAVDEAPHNFYRYPARFSPEFARECIKAFTREGDTVIDPFCGGGTAVLEAMFLGRKAAGFDISTLATFVTRTKTTPLSVNDLRSLKEWVAVIADLDESLLWERNIPSKIAKAQIRNLPELPTRFFSTVLYYIERLPSRRQKNFARLALLGVGQNYLDCRKRLPLWNELRDSFTKQLLHISTEHHAFITRLSGSAGVRASHINSLRRIINRTAEDIDVDGRIPNGWLPAKLILTSPPYPGVHVLYHRWQIEGRRETPAPFWLAGSNDGAGEAFYTLGGRKQKGHQNYYSRLVRVFKSVRKVLDSNSLIVRLVAFARPDWQLAAYLKSMVEAGFEEAAPVCNSNLLFKGRIWRQVPGRKWYAWNQGKTDSSREALLLHTPRS